MQTQMMHQHDHCDVLVIDEEALLAAEVALQGQLNERTLRAVLNAAAQTGEMRRQLRRTANELAAARTQVDRLAEMVCEASSARMRWLTQRHIMECLHQEVDRAERYSTPLSVILGAIRTTGPEPGACAGPQVLQEWLSEGVVQNKRRTDIAGQYGPDGFMIVLPQTDAKGAAAFCRRLKRTLQQLHAPGESLIRLDLGAASRSSTLASAQSLLRRAEEQWEMNQQTTQV